MPPLSLRGVVTKAGFMSKTVIVTVTRRVEHPHTHKVIERSKKYLTHDPKEELREGDMCIITNCPPVSARKRFKLESIIKRVSSTNSEAGGEAIKMSAELPPNSG